MEYLLFIRDPGKLQNLVKVKENGNLIILGDFNATVGKGRDDKVVGSIRLGTRNNRGDRLVEFCNQNR